VAEVKANWGSTHEKGKKTKSEKGRGGKKSKTKSRNVGERSREK